MNKYCKYKENYLNLNIHDGAGLGAGSSSDPAPNPASKPRSIIDITREKDMTREEDMIQQLDDLRIPKSEIRVLPDELTKCRKLLEKLKVKNKLLKEEAEERRKKEAEENEKNVIFNTMTSPYTTEQELILLAEKYPNLHTEHYYISFLHERKEPKICRSCGVRNFYFTTNDSNKLNQCQRCYIKKKELYIFACSHIYCIDCDSKIN